MKKKFEVYRVWTDNVKKVEVQAGRWISKASCHPDDTFDLAKGFMIALARAKNNFVPEEGQTYYSPCFDGDEDNGTAAVKEYHWYGEPSDFFKLQNGLVFKNYSEAQKAAKEMIEALKRKLQKPEYLYRNGQLQRESEGMLRATGK